MKYGSILLLVVALFAFASAAQAQNNACDQPGEEPDVIVGGLYSAQRYGTIGDITAYSIGTESCNIGTCHAEWFSGTPGLHPVIAQNLYRLKDGRFEQIGMSWLKHSFATLDNNLCSGGGCLPGGGQHLGVNCSDPYGPGLNASQSGLGPRSEVNANEGTHLHPYTTQGQSGNSIYKRLQVHNDDLDPALNPGALYFAEGQYVTHDDAAAGNNWNNNSYRNAIISQVGSNFEMTLTGPTVRERAAIWAWPENETGVILKEIQNQYIGAMNTTDLGGGMWHYEYALENVIATHDAQAVSIPIPHGVTISNVGFHDVDYHSGEVYDGSDWTVTIDTASNPNTITWATKLHSQDPNANALRWSSIYNFRFDADVEPGASQATIHPFKPGGSPLAWGIFGPNRCGDAFCDSDENQFLCAVDCAASTGAGQVPDGDGTPGNQLLVDLEIGGDLTLMWDASCLGSDTDYEIYEGDIGSWSSHQTKTCSTGGATMETVTPIAGSTYYLVVPRNGTREGSYGVDSSGSPRGQGMSACIPQQLDTCQ